MPATTDPLGRVSTVAAIVGRVRDDVLDGRLAPGAHLGETELAAELGVGRHSVRAALRELVHSGLLVAQANRGCFVRALDPAGVQGLYELRAALEIEAVHLALERHGTLPPAVETAVAELEALGRDLDVPWRRVVDAHTAVHAELVRASDSPRLVAAHGALEAEMSLFVVHLRPHTSARALGPQHRALLEAIGTSGPGALRQHLREGAATVVAAVT